MKIVIFYNLRSPMQLLNILFVYCLLFAASPGGFAQGKIAVAFYNCENLFDIVDDPAKNDEEFTPGGKYHYTEKIYRQKLHNIAAVLQAMNNARGPAIIGLAEVENSIVLNDLTHQSEIADHKYQYVLHDGPDPRGINVALVYDPALFRVLKSEPVHIDISATGGKSVTREVLHVHGILAGDTVDVFVNHWPSRRGGEDESGPKREIAANVNKKAADGLLKKNRNARIIIMGDFNDNPDDKSIATILSAKADVRNVTATQLYNPFANIYRSGTGTEVFKHQWNLFDQVIISGTLLNIGRLHYESAEVYKPAFIQDTYKGHVGEPKRSFVGTKWINGYSDHFPVVVYLSH